MKIKNRCFSIIIFLLLASLLNSCQKASDIDSSKLTPVIDADKTAIAGIIVEGIKPQPVEGIVVRLGNVIWSEDKTDGNFIIDGANSPSTITDVKGYFLFNNIDVDDYVIVIGNLEESPTVVVQKDQKEKAEIFSPKINEALFVGNLNLDNY